MINKIKTAIILILYITVSFGLVQRSPVTRAVQFGSGSSTDIVISINGNVGIGTANPTEKLDISGKIALDGVVIAYRPTSMNGTLIIGDGGTNLSHVSGLDGYNNTFVGIGVGSANTTGYANAAMGYYALFANTSGVYNSAMGHAALYSNTTGAYNAAMGYAAGNYALGNNNTFIGSNSDIQGGLSLNNATAIGYNALVATSNALVLGGLGADAVRVGIGTATPSYTLEVQGQIFATSLTVDGVVTANRFVGNIVSPVVTKAANYSATSLDSVILVSNSSATITITLPLASTMAGRTLTIKKMDSNDYAVILSRTGSDTVDGTTSVSLYSQYQYVIVSSDGLTNWFKMGGN